MEKDSVADAFSVFVPQCERIFNVWCLHIPLSDRSSFSGPFFSLSSLNIYESITVSEKSGKNGNTRAWGLVLYNFGFGSKRSKQLLVVLRFLRQSSVIISNFVTAMYRCISRPGEAG